MRHPYPALPGNSPDTPSEAQRRGWAELAQFVAGNRHWSMAKTGRALCPTGTLAGRRMDTPFGEFSFTIRITGVGDWYFTCSGPDNHRFETAGDRDEVLNTVRMGQRALSVLEDLADKYTTAGEALEEADERLTRQQVMFLADVLGVRRMLLQVLGSVMVSAPTAAEREFMSYFSSNAGWTVKPWQGTVRAERVVRTPVGKFTFRVWLATRGGTSVPWCAQAIRGVDEIVREWFDHRDVAAKQITMARQALEKLEVINVNPTYPAHCRYVVSHLKHRQLQFLRRALELPNGTDAEIAAAVIHKVTGMWITVEPHNLVR